MRKQLLIPFAFGILLVILLFLAGQVLSSIPTAFGDDPTGVFDDSKTTDEDMPVEITLGASHVGCITTGNPVVVEILDPPDFGTVIVGSCTVVGSDVNFEATYTPDPNFNGFDDFTYQVCHGADCSNGLAGTTCADEPQDGLGCIRITLDLVDDGPTCNAAEGSTSPGVPDQQIVTCIDIDSGCTSPAFAFVSLPANGTVETEALNCTTVPGHSSATPPKSEDDASIQVSTIYTPNPGFCGGSDTFRFALINSNVPGATASKTVTVGDCPTPTPTSTPISTSPTTPVVIPAALPPTGGAPAADAGLGLWQLLAGLGGLGGLSVLGAFTRLIWRRR